MIRLNAMKIMMLLALIFITGALHAQRGYGMQRGFGSPYGYSPKNDSLRTPHQGLNLTEDQQKQMNDLRTVYLKEITSLRNDLAIKEAELNKYQSADKPDMNIINKTIDEIGKLRTDVMKKRAAHRVAVLNILTDEQKVLYNNMRNGMGRHGMKGGMRGFDRSLPGRGPGLNNL